MPNGGMMPCCWVCRWGISQSIQEPSVICERHHLTTYLPLATFCSELALQSDDSQRRYFSGKEFDPKPGIMYEWLQIAYTDVKHPGIPQYYHEPADIAPVREYSTWSKQQQVTTSQARHEHKRQELTKLD